MKLRRVTILVAIGLGVAAIVAAYFLWPGLPREASAALDHAETFELFSIDPDIQRRAPTTQAENFHGYRAMGRLTIDKLSTRQELIRALRDGTGETSVAACFNPRHGIRVTTASGTVDFVICFECHQVLMFANGRQAASWLTNESPRTVFNRVLTDAGIPLPSGEY